MNENISEEQLISRAKLGDKEAISALYERHVDQIYRYIAYRTPESDAEDLTAEVFVRMVESLPSFVYTGAPFEAWLYRIASARVADFHRKKGRRQISSIDDDFSDDDPLPEDKMQQKQEHRELREALSNLSDDDQQILILRFVERKSHEEVAEIMGRNSAAIRTAQHRALKKLATHLDAKGKERHYLRGRPSPDE
ncbi:MAG: sigma-70 family RNA polymerase sigma factor [Phototrophicaceae bacterium]